MKKTLLILLAAMAFYGCRKDLAEESQEDTNATRSIGVIADYYYGYDGSKIPLTRINNKYYVLTESTVSQKRIRGFEKEGYNVYLFSKEQNFSFIKEDLSDKKFDNIKKAQSLIVSGKEISTTDGIIYTTPFYKTPQGNEIGITERFRVKLKSEQDLPALEKLAAENNLLSLGKYKNTNWNVFLCTKESRGNALQMSNLFYETGLCKLV